MPLPRERHFSGRQIQREVVAVGRHRVLQGVDSGEKATFALVWCQFERKEGGLNLQAQHYWSAGDPGTDFWRTSAYTSRGVLAFNVSLGLVLSESAISSSSSWV